MSSPNTPRRAHHTLTTSGVHVFVVRSPHVVLTIDLAVRDAEAHIYGVYRGTDAAAYTLDITQHHIAPHTVSACTIYTVLDDSATLTITNTIRIAADAHGANATATLRTLLLADTVRTVVTPHMDVIPADVRSTHTASAVPISEVQRTYLHTRGIADTKAVALLATAFTKDIEDHIARAPHAIIM